MITFMCLFVYAAIATCTAGLTVEVKEFLPDADYEARITGAVVLGLAWPIVFACGIGKGLWVAGTHLLGIPYAIQGVRSLHRHIFPKKEPPLALPRAIVVNQDNLE